MIFEDRRNFLELGEKVEGFCVTGSPLEPPEGLTNELLWNLWDIGIKFGQRTEKGLFFKCAPLVMELYDFRGNQIGGKAGMAIFKKRGEGPFVATGKGTCIFELQNELLVIWDGGFTTTDIASIIQKIDEHAKNKGLIDSEGKRIKAY